MDNVIKFLDFYDTHVTFSYKNSHAYKTVFGGILSIITCLVLVIVTLIFAESVFSKENFKIISTSKINQFSNFDFSKIPILIGLADPGGSLMNIDEKLFNIIVTEYHLIVTKEKNHIINITINDTEFELDNCEKYKGNKSYFLNDTFKNFELSRFQCIKPGQNLTFFGKYKDSINGYRGMRIIVEKCNNESLKSKNKNITCYPKEIIDNKLLNVKLFTYYIGFNINHYSFDNNYLLYIESGYYSRFSTTIFKSYEASFTKNIYITDRSIIFNHRIRKEFITPSGCRTDETDRDALNFRESKRMNENTIGVISLFLDGEEVKHDRSFESILDVFVNIGGISNLLTIIFGFMNKYVARRIKKIDLVKTLLFDKNIVQRLKSSRISKVNDNKSNKGNNNKIIPEKKSYNNNLMINSSKMNFITNMKRKSFFINKNRPNDLERVIFNNIIKNRNNHSVNKNNMENNFNKNSNNFSYSSRTELKEKFNRFGKKIICFYILPFFISNRIENIKFIEKLYLNVNKNLSLEKLYFVLREWSNIKEKILNIESLFQEWLY